MQTNANTIRLVTAPTTHTKSTQQSRHVQTHVLFGSLRQQDVMCHLDTRVDMAAYSRSGLKHDINLEGCQPSRLNLEPQGFQLYLKVSRKVVRIARYFGH